MQPDLSDTFCRYGLDAHMRKHEKYCIVTKHNKTTSPSLVYCLFQFIEIQEEAQRVLSRRAAPVKIGGVLSAGWERPGTRRQSQREVVLGRTLEGRPGRRLLRWQTSIMC